MDLLQHLSPRIKPALQNKRWLHLWGCEDAPNNSESTVDSHVLIYSVLLFIVGDTFRKELGIAEKGGL